MSDKITNYGKIRYIEPNDFLNRDGYNNVIQNYEDYSISVDLTVKVPNRMGSTKDGDTYILFENKNLNNGTFSFFTGTDGNLTSNPGSVIYEDICNSNTKSINENLGITSINIAYNSYHYPEVTINFTDIRGSALMMPHEENYRRHQVNSMSNEKVYNEQVQNFFSSLFSFPSPEFILHVKGFYGKKIEYRLLVVDFRSSFNNETGNFDATVKFIGKMYGLYTDIPMTYLLIAPYCKYGNQNNLTIWEQKHFTFDNGSRMPTFIELKELIARSNENLEYTMNFKSVGVYNNLRNEQILLQEVKNSLTDVINYFTTKYKNSEDVFFIKKYILFSYDEIDKCNYLYPNKKNDELSLYIKKLYETIRNYNNSNSKKLPFIDGIVNEVSQIGSSIIDMISFEKEEKYSEKEDENNNITYNLTSLKKNNEEKKDDNSVKIEYKDIIENLTKRLNRYPNGKKNTESFVITSYEKLEKELTSFIIDNNNILVKTKEEMTNENNEHLEKILGFVPSVRNIFKMIMAHLQVFSELFNRLLENISTDNNRKLSELNLSLENLIDLPNNKDNSNELTIPPFPALKNSINNEYCYATDLSFEMEETNFIDSLFECTFDYLEKDKKIKDLIAELNDETIELLPTCISDLYYKNNPYKYVFNNKNTTIDIDWIFTYFGIRLITAMCFEQNFTPGNIGKFEAYNFWRVNKNLSKEIIEKIKSVDFNGDNFINFLLNKKNPYILNNTPCYVNGNIKKILTSNTNDDSFLFVTKDFASPVSITRDNLGIQGFWRDSKINNGNGDGKYTFFKTQNLKDSAIPYEYIKIVSNELIEQWDSNIKKNDLAQIFGESEPINIPVSGRNLNSFFTKYYNLSYINDEKREILNKGFLNNFQKLDDDVKQRMKSYGEFGDENLPNEYNLFQYRVYNEPCFFNEEITPEDFLLNIPINNMKLYGELISVHKTDYKKNMILTIPYTMQLFLGMFIYALKNGKSDIIEKCAKTCKEYDSNNSKFYKDERLFSIIPLIGLFLRKNDGSIYTGLKKYAFAKNSITKYTRSFYHDDEEFIDGYILNSYEQIVSVIKDIETSIDFLDLSGEYERWSKSTAPGGFLYFKNMYLLKDNNETIWNKDTNYEFEIPSENYNTPLKRLLYFFNKKIKNKTEKDIPFLKDILNNAFQSPYDNNKSGTAFTDRYTNINLIDNSLYIGFNQNFEAYTHLNDFFKKTNKLIYVASDATGRNRSDLIAAFNKFKQYLITFYDSQELNKKNNETEDDKFTKNTITIESKLSMYRTLKNIFDKHFATLPRDIDKFNINEKDGEFGRIHYVDTYFNDLGDSFLFNAELIIDTIEKISSTGVIMNNGVIHTDMSLYSFMALLCQNHNMMLLSMPVFNGNFTTKEGVDNFKTMFTPLPYVKTINENVMSGPSYICFYPHQPSQFLDIPNGQYKNDGFNIIEDINNTGSFEGPISINDLQDNGSGYIIPAFSVEYGSQKQSVFKSVNVNMDNPQVTEVSVANQYSLAQTDNTEFRKLGFEGQDLYRIYSNYSYTCEVEMMGCAQILPLMYFQLNNIPMFRGTYQIIKVEHNIVPGDMVTRFKGIRLNKTKIPLIQGGLKINTINEMLDSQNDFNKITYNTHLFTGTLFGNKDNKKDINSIIPYKNTNINNLSYNSVLNTYPNINFSKISTFDSEEGAFNNLNPEIRKLLLSLSKRMDENGLGINVTSMTRRQSDSSSDHVINSPNAKNKRKYNSYIVLNEQNKEIEKNGTQLGCAIDLNGTINGSVNKTNGSIPLFHLIATEYTRNIRQLIWEVGKNNSSAQDSISNCIHLSSYGDEESNNYTAEIFVATGDKWESVKSDNLNNYKKAPRNLPPMFIKTLYDLSKMEWYKNVKLNNFISSSGVNRKPNTSDLEKWCEELEV